MKYFEAYVKHFSRNTIILMGVFGFVIAIMVGWALGALGNLVMWEIIAFMTLVWSAVGTLGSLLFLRVFYPQMGIRVGMEAKESATGLAPVEKYGMGTEIEYMLQVEDALALHSYLDGHYPRAKRLHRLVLGMAWLSVGVLILADVALLLISGSRFLSLVVILAALAVLDLLYWIVGRPLLRKSIPRAIVRNYAQESSRILRRRKVWISAEGLSETTDAGRSLTKWSALEYALFDSQYLFILQPGSAARVVPKRAFHDEESFKEFVSQVSSYCKPAT